MEWYLDLKQDDLLLLLALDLNKKVPGEQNNLKVYEDAPENIKKF